MLTTEIERLNNSLQYSQKQLEENKMNISHLEKLKSNLESVVYLKLIKFIEVLVKI